MLRESIQRNRRECARLEGELAAEIARSGVIEGQIKGLQESVGEGEKLGVVSPANEGIGHE